MPDVIGAVRVSFSLSWLLRVNRCLPQMVCVLCLLLGLSVGWHFGYGRRHLRACYFRVRTMTQSRTTGGTGGRHFPSSSPLITPRSVSLPVEVLNKKAW